MASPSQKLTADYNAPLSESRSFSHSLPACSSTPSTEDRRAYLSSLHASIGKLQDEVNSFLTQKMEDDQKMAVTGRGIMDEVKEEQNYGEEVVDDEA
jgi:hypothetical protein